MAKQQQLYYEYAQAYEKGMTEYQKANAGNPMPFVPDGKGGYVDPDASVNPPKNVVNMCNLCRGECRFPDHHGFVQKVTVDSADIPPMPHRKPPPPPHLPNEGLNSSGSGTVTISAAEYQSLKTKGAELATKVVVGARAVFPPHPTRNGYRYYIPSTELVEKGMKLGIYAGANCAGKAFPPGYAWGEMPKGTIHAFSTLDEAASAFFRHHPTRWTFQLWK